MNEMNETALRLALRYSEEYSPEGVLEIAATFLTFLRFGQRPAPAAEPVAPDPLPRIPFSAYAS